MSEKQEPQPIVFVSSVIVGYEQFRNAAERAIVSTGCRPLLINEQLPSSTESSRNVCLDGVEAADVVIVLIGSKGGWVTPSGKTVVEEEVEHAKRCKKQILVFLQSIDRDESATWLANQLSDYVSGRFRRTFSNELELEKEIQNALRPIETAFSVPENSASAVNDVIGSKSKVKGTVLTTVLLPIRDEELVPPQDFGTTAFVRQIQELAHSGPNPVFDYGFAVSPRQQGDWLWLEQRSERGEVTAALGVSEKGAIRLDACLDLVRERNVMDVTASFLVDEVEIERWLVTTFTFAHAYFGRFDPHERMNALLLNAKLDEMGMKSIKRAPVPATSYTQNIFATPNSAEAYSGCRRISRQDLKDPPAEVMRLLVSLKRAVEPKRSSQLS